jgi:hypothetical protein
MSKKKGFSFKPWQALVAVLFVAVAGYVVVRFSSAATAPQNGKLLTVDSSTSPNSYALHNVPTNTSETLSWVTTNPLAFYFPLAKGNGSTQISNDGKRLYGIRREEGNPSKYIISSYSILDGSDRKDIVEITQAIQETPEMFLSPDNTVITYSSRQLVNGQQRRKLYTVSVPVGAPKSTGTAPAPKEMPVPEIYDLVGITKANKVVFRLIQQPGAGYYRINPDGSGQEKLNSFFDYRNLVSISPVEDKFLEVAGPPAGGAPPFVKIYNLDASEALSLGTNILSLLSNNDYSLFSSLGWSPDGKYIYLQNLVINVATGGVTTTLPASKRIYSWAPLPTVPAGFSHTGDQLTGGALGTKADGTTGYRVAQSGQSIQTTYTKAEASGITGLCAHVKVISAVTNLRVSSAEGQAGGGEDLGPKAPGTYDVCSSGWSTPQVAATVSVTPTGGSIGVDKIYSK